MRQVPAFETAPIGLVGDGRAARHFHHYFNLLGLPVCAWSRRASRAVPSPAALGECRTVLLLIQDAAIVPFVEAWPACERSGWCIAPAVSRRRSPKRRIP